jgi:hypothetical protein
MARISRLPRVGPVPSASSILLPKNSTRLYRGLHDPDSRARDHQPRFEGHYGKSSTATSAPAARPTHSEAVEKRRQFARGIHSMTLEGGILRNISVTTEDEGDKSLVMTADNIVEDD